MKGPQASQPANGFTLMELAMAAAFFAVVVMAVVLSLVKVSDLGQLSRQNLAAIADANRVLEAMRDTANTSVAAVAATDWTAWANANVIGTKGQNEISLPQEAVTVTFANPNANPIQCIVTVNWQHRQRPYSYQVVTLMTDRG